jgi:hypothetical protein
MIDKKIICNDVNKVNKSSFIIIIINTINIYLNLPNILSDFVSRFNNNLLLEFSFI